MIHESNKVFSLLKICWLLYMKFYLLILQPVGKMMDPFFRENESSEASGRSTPPSAVASIVPSVSRAFLSPFLERLEAVLRAKSDEMS